MFDFLIQHTPLLYFTQSLWRDEAYSILVAQRPLGTTLAKLSFEPPVYYILLHYWMKLFGNSEIATRSLSFLGFALATIVVIVWAEKLFRRHWLSWYLPVFFFFNPMLLYYAFEVRTYGWYIFFTTLSYYSYHQKRWVLLVLSTVLGFYTHTYFIFVPLSQTAHWFLSERKKVLTLLKTHGFKAFVGIPFVRSGLVALAVMMPWLWKMVGETAKLRESWYFPVNIQLVASALGNMFLGYEGTPGHLWRPTAYLSAALLVVFALAMRPTKTRTRNAYFLMAIVLPLVIVVGVSFIKPMFVNRYLIPVTIAEVLLLVSSIESIRSSLWQRLAAATLLAGVLAFNLWYPSKHAKVDIRASLRQIRVMLGPGDIILARSPLVFFESIYYSPDPARVFLYNPHRVAFPWYVGDSIVSSSQMTDTFPSYPARAFLVYEDGSFDISYTLALPLAGGRKTAK